MLREPVFMRLRDDLAAGSIRGGPQARAPKTKALATPTNEIEAVLQQLETKASELELNVGSAHIRLTNLDREYWPADARARRSPRNQARFTALSRRHFAVHAAAPEGPAADHDPHARRHRRRAVLPEALGAVAAGFRRDDHRVLRTQGRASTTYLLANNLPTLLWLGQVGTLEFHVWHSRAKVEEDALSKQHRLLQLARSARIVGAQLSRTTWSSTSIPTSIPARKRKGAEPELNKKGFAVGSASRSGCASCSRKCHSTRW